MRDKFREELLRRIAEFQLLIESDDDVIKASYWEYVTQIETLKDVLKLYDKCQKESLTKSVKFDLIEWFRRLF